MHTSSLRLSSRYRDAIYFTLFSQQLPIAVLCLLLLDGGRCARVCGIAMVAFWSAVALVMARRPDAPEPSDLLYLRWGFLPVLVLSGCLRNLLF